MVAHVAGIYCEEAAVGLLIGHRRWLCREDFLDECVQVGVAEVDVFACVDWAAAVAGLNRGVWPVRAVSGGCCCWPRVLPRASQSI